MEPTIHKFKGANMDIDLATPPGGYYLAARRLPVESSRINREPQVRR